MNRRFTLKTILPMLLLGAAFAGSALPAWLAPDADAGPSRGGASEAKSQAIGAASGEKPGSIDTTQWTAVSRSVDGVTFTYRYPPGWSADLAYCATTGAVAGEERGHLPTDCASTDFLVGQKARDIGQIEGTAVTVGDKRAVRLVDTNPRNVLVAQTYTLMVYSASGEPLFGFTNQVGHDTNPPTLAQITGSLDGVVATLRVEESR